ncbi:7-deoxyloganetin glucosyltransferase-like [Humulus lupulus]|uniref:7-deoxyloganetin glucosyltransferase-like n=1 Tax=Humulus lupulus TaxID=3486 RepID=UPI002B4034F6|nr:7-deoxyloganetin glucosyltransferase-like [Humulus lupulus]
MDSKESVVEEVYNNRNNSRPHAVCIPYPSQSHIKAMLKLAKLLHHKGLYITFVNTEFNHNRFLKNSPSFSSSPSFRFETIPDGLPPADQAPDSTQDIPSLCDSTRKNFLGPFLELLNKLENQSKSRSKDNVPPRVSCIVNDGVMSFAIKAAQQLGVPVVQFFTVAACTVMGLSHYRTLLDQGIVPLKDENNLTNGFLDTKIEWVPGMKNLRFRDLPTFCRITDSNDIMFNWILEAIEEASKASATVIHTFEALERHVLEALSSSLSLPNIYPIGPLQLLLDQIPEDPLNYVPYSLWKEEPECIKWLSTQKPNSVIYANFGSIAVLTKQQVVEIGWGLANSNHPFLWVIRPDLVIGESANLPSEFLDQTKGRSLIINWSPQEDVLNHPSLGGFLTHCGWNSIMESLTSGVPMICYPYFADQQTNCWFACNEWGVALEIENEVKRDQVTKLVKELLEGEKGKKMKIKAMEWKKLAQEATTAPHGSSSRNLDDLLNQVLLQQIE